jgi:Single-strand binding protein family
MIRALVSGILFADPQVRTSKAGTTYCTAKLRADGKDGVSVWCSLIAFGEPAERLLTLKANAALSVSGKAELQAWLSKTGEPAAGLSLVVDDLAVLKPKPRPPQAPEKSYPQAGVATQQSYPQATAGFDDMDRWQ